MKFKQEWKGGLSLADPVMHAAVEKLLKYGDVARGNLKAPIKPRFKEYLE